MLIGPTKLAWVVVTALLLTACGPPEMVGIPIRQELYDSFHLLDQNHYKDLMRRSIDGNSKAFIRLIHFDCGGASFCYWHGEVLAKIVYQMGEEKMLELVENMTSKDKSRSRHLLRAGLEYGAFTTDGTLTNQPSNLEIEHEFLRLNQWLLIDSN